MLNGEDWENYLVRGHVRELRGPVRRMALCHGGVHRVDIDNDRVADLREESDSHGGDGGGRVAQGRSRIARARIRAGGGRKKVGCGARGLKPGGSLADKGKRAVRTACPAGAHKSGAGIARGAEATEDEGFTCSSHVKDKGYVQCSTAQCPLARSIAGF